LVTEAYRFEGHYAGEPEVYRERAEVDAFRAQDPIPRFRAHLIEGAIAQEAELDALDESIRREIDDAIAFARSSPQPEPSTAMDYIYAE